MSGSFEMADMELSASNSFWECREYLRTVKRVDAANKLCSELAFMIQERADIEKAFATNLKKWSSRWSSFLSNGLEYASGKCAWQGLCEEAEQLSNAHQSIHDVLMEEIHNGVKFWQKEHFHKTTLPPQSLKESKQFEQDFEQAQKAWAKRLKKVSHCKKNYHQVCKMERSLQVQLQNAKNDPSGTPEQVKKVQDKLTKVEKELDRARTLYKNSLSDLDADNPRYLEDMTKVFDRTQEFERERIIEFKQVFGTLQQALNVTRKIDYDSVYAKLDQSIARVDPEADLAFWSTHHGVDMPAVEAHFEEYSPELTTLSGSKKRTHVAETNSGVTLTSISPTVSSPSPIDQVNHTKSENTTNGIKADISTPFDDHRPASQTTPDRPEHPPPVSNVNQSADPDQNEELNDADYYSATFDDGRPGVSVKALYDYIGQEDDELTLKAGDEFEQLEEADDQGWCKGRKDGRAGLYPANYAEPI